MSDQRPKSPKSRPEKSLPEKNQPAGKQLEGDQPVGDLSQVRDLPVPDGDVVDAIVAAWKRERPDLNVLPMTILSRITRMSRRLDLVRRDAFAEHQLELWEFDVLAALRRAGAPYELSPGVLAAETLVTSGTMTNRVDRLVSRALVTRRVDPNDRRAALIELTPTGMQLVDLALESLLVREEKFLAGFDADQSETLASLLRTMSRTLGA